MTTVLRGGRVIDGSGRADTIADVVVSGDRISEVVAPGRGHGTTVIDVGGLVVAPGFIDMHAHSDLQLLASPDHAAKVTQGVTCEVIGQDGLSYAPVDDVTLTQMRQQIAGWNDDLDDAEFTWRSVGEYLDRLDQGIAVNAAYLIPQGTVRHLVVGPDDRRPSADELRAMQDVVARGLREGAAGLSAGLTYVPGMYADDDELAALLSVVVEGGGYFSPHHRSYGVGAIEAYRDMLALSERTGCPLHLTHATLNFACNAGRASELISLLDDALERSVDVTIDSYPYLPGATTLASLLPSWAAQGGSEQILHRLADPAERDRIAHHIEVVGSDGWHGVPAEWDTVVISGVADQASADAVGRSIAQIAAERDIEPIEAFFELLVADRLRTGILLMIGNEDNVRALMAHPTHCAGSDAILVGARPHPRAWGTFPEYLGRYVREEGVLDLVDCIHHMTGRPAARLRLADRGLVRPGHLADLVVFDPSTVAARSTYADPRRPAVGIEHVWLGGVPTVESGTPTGALPGRSLRRRADGRLS